MDRRVNTGQTVVASLNVPSLFLIAKDLARMQIWASVNEADIGQIQPGQDVRFTVDAHPDRMFKGTVAQIRLNATIDAKRGHLHRGRDLRQRRCSRACRWKSAGERTCLVLPDAMTKGHDLGKKRAAEQPL